LETALETLTVLTARRMSIERQGGIDAERLDAANRLYEQCVTLQNAAIAVYANAKAVADRPRCELASTSSSGYFPRRGKEKRSPS